MRIIVDEVLMSREGYTHPYWLYEDIFVQFSRLYYIVGGEAYYRDGNEVTRLKHGHLYLTPVKHKFTLYENENDKLLHTYAHITTLPPCDRLIEIDISSNACLADAVGLWRKYISVSDYEQTKHIINFILSNIDFAAPDGNALASRVKEFIDGYNGYDITLGKIALAVGYSVPHINKVFAAQYSMSPIKYFNTKRLARALELLSEGVEIKRIATLLNYDSPSAFSKAFRQKYGLSPSKYIIANTIR